MQARGRGELQRVVHRIQLHQDGVEIVEYLAGKKDQFIETRIELAEANARPRFDEEDIAERDATARGSNFAIRRRLAPRHFAFRARR
jgi:uncharacterized membrane protein